MKTDITTERNYKKTINILYIDTDKNYSKQTFILLIQLFNFTIISREVKFPRGCIRALTQSFVTYCLHTNLKLLRKMF